jgi:excisionase family DNA binding protein
MMRRLMTIKQVCDAYAVSRTTVYKLIAEGKLQRVKVGRATRIPTDSADTCFIPPPDPNDAEE